LISNFGKCVQQIRLQMEAAMPTLLFTNKGWAHLQSDYPRLMGKRKGDSV